jgi:hypothetical protein
MYFEERRPLQLQKLIPNIDEEGADLLASMLRYDPSTRLTAA